MRTYKSRRAVIMLSAILLILLSGCGALQALEPTPTPNINVDEEESQIYIMRAKAELSRQKGMDPDDIQLVSIEFTEFSDASLGVPEPGVDYAQVITPGYVIILKHRGKTYEFHAAGNRIVRVPE